MNNLFFNIRLWLVRRVLFRNWSLMIGWDVAKAGVIASSRHKRTCFADVSVHEAEIKVAK